MACIYQRNIIVWDEFLPAIQSNSYYDNKKIVDMYLNKPHREPLYAYAFKQDIAWAETVDENTIHDTEIT